MSAFSPPTVSLSTDAPNHAEQWLVSAHQGNRDAFACLCELHRKRVWNVVASVTRRSADTDDLAQDALVRAWTALPGYRGEAQAFGAWLCRIALNAAHDYQKSAWRRRVLLGCFLGSDAGNEAVGDLAASPLSFAALKDAAPGPQEEALRRETARRVRAAVTALAPKERVPIWLVYFEQYSLSDVARMENVPESTIRSRVKCGLRRLEKTLHDLNAVSLAAEEAACENATYQPSSHGRSDAFSAPHSPASPAPPPADWKGCVSV